MTQSPTRQEDTGGRSPAPPRRTTGYPSAAELRRVRTLKDPNRALDALRAAWIDGYGSESETLSVAEHAVIYANPQDRYLRLATGGWSGNEDLIEALAANTVAWGATWRLSTWGGLHLFCYRRTLQRGRR